MVSHMYEKIYYATAPDSASSIHNWLQVSLHMTTSVKENLNFKEHTILHEWWTLI
jgi:hypothetical protein